jgi:hypothetical protein
LFRFVTRIVTALTVGFFDNADSNDGVGDPQYLRDIRTAVSMEDVENLLQEIMDAGDAPSPNNAVRSWPFGVLHAFDRVRDAELADVLNKTEFMIVRFYQKGHLTLRLGQLLFEMLRHPEFDIREVRIGTTGLM